MNCDFCVKRNLVNRNGRICAFAFDGVEYETPTGDIKGIARSIEDYTNAVWNIMERYMTDSVVVGLRYFKNGSTYGLCPKSFFMYERVAWLLNLIHLCVSNTEYGVELLHLPYEGSILEQPNIFIQAFLIYRNEVAEYRIKQLKELDKDAK